MARRRQVSYPSGFCTAAIVVGILISSAIASGQVRKVADPEDPLSSYSNTDPTVFSPRPLPSNPRPSQPTQPTQPNGGGYANPNGGVNPNLSGSACLPSTLPGYTSRVALEGQSLFLHWARVSPDMVAFAVEAIVGGGAAKGWIALGWSSGTAMAPADAVIGNTEGEPVAPYTIVGYAAADVVTTDTFSVGPTASVEISSNRTVLRFSRSTGDGGQFPVSVQGVNNLIWAHSKFGNKKIDYHGSKRGSLAVDFSCVGGDAFTPTAPDTSFGDYGDTGDYGGAGSGAGAGEGAGAVGGNCPKSALNGYTYFARLDGGNLLLHWRVPAANVLQLAVEAPYSSPAANGWLSVGWSRSGAMVPADAVIGNLPGVFAYHLGGYRMRDVQRAQFPLGSNATVVTAPSGSIIMKFAITEGMGAVPLNIRGGNVIVWAFSSAGSALGYHGGNCGSARVDFSCTSRTTDATGTVGDNLRNGDDDDDDYDIDDAHDVARRQRRYERRRNRQQYYGTVWQGVWGSIDTTP